MTFSIVVEGNIGSGKSTFIQRLSKEMSDMVEVLKEPVAEWQDLNGHNLLELFYKDATKYAVGFQTYVGLTMARRGKLVHKKPITLAERSMASGINCFIPLQRQLGVIDEALEAVLLDLMSHLSAGLVEPDLIIYLRCDPSVAVRRMIGRNREEESSVIPDYLTKLHDLHEIWFDKLSKVSRVLVFDNNAEITENDQSVYRDLAAKIRKLM